MPAQVGKRYKAGSGAEIIVTKGSPGASLTDGEIELVLSDSGQTPPAGPGGEDIQLGKRYQSADGSVEVLVIKPGRVDLRCGGEPMTLLQPKVLPSAD